jgi:GTPase
MKIAPQETEEGNIEYKRFFINITNTKLNHLTAQMNWRINEGYGICHYYLGICDDGTVYTDFNQEKIDYTLDVLNKMIDGCNSYIENIKINRPTYDLFWLDITIKRKPEYITEYRILLITKSQFFLSNIIPDYKVSKSVYFNTIIHNNEKYLFFECKNINKIINKINFNLILYSDPDNLYEINNINIPTINIDNYEINNLDNLMNLVEHNLLGNDDLIQDNNIHFNIIKYHYNNSIGHIVSGFLKKGIIKSGMDLYLKNDKNIYNINIISIHNNMKDCNEIIAPSTISLRISSKDNFNKINGYIFNQ